MSQRNYPHTPVSAPITAGSDDRDPIAIAFGNEMACTMFLFENIAERNDFTAKFTARLYGSWCLVKHGNDDGEPVWFEWTGVNINGSDGKWSVINVSIVSSAQKTIVGGGVTIDDGLNDLGTVTGLLLKSMTATPDEKNPGLATLEPYILLQELQNKQYGGKANVISLYEPLEVFEDPDKENAVIMRVKEGYFEQSHTPSFYACLENELMIVQNQNKAIRSGNIYFDSVYSHTGNALTFDAKRKAYGLQEVDGGDPNITGGTPNLVICRLSLKGKAPLDGYVELCLKKTPGILGVPDTGIEILTDEEGQPFAARKHYSKGQDLGDIEVAGIYRAKGLVEFNCELKHTFGSDELLINDKSEGASCLLVQTIDSNEKTSISFLQYESDTQQKVTFTTHYLGGDLANVEYMSPKIPIKEGPAGNGLSSPDGWHFYNSTKIAAGYENEVLTFKSASDGTKCFFSFGHVFNSEYAKMLAGKELVLKATLENQSDVFKVGLFAWSGEPDSYGEKIITDCNNSTITTESGWTLVDSDISIPEVADATGNNVIEKFTIPANCNNFAILIYPLDKKSPISLKIKDFIIGVEEPSYGFILKESKSINEQHLAFSDRYKRFSMNAVNIGGYGARYTITSAGVPMPVGLPGKGKADIDLDPTINKVAGSQIGKGEGAIKFGADGKATVKTSLNVYAGEKLKKGETQPVTFWYEMINSEGKKIKITDSETSFDLTGGDKIAHVCSMKPFTISVNAFDRIYLQAKCTVDDGAYLASYSANQQLIETEIDFKELAASLPVY